MSKIEAYEEPAENGAGPADDLERWLWAHRPAAAPARPEFRTSLERRFSRAAAQRGKTRSGWRGGWLFSSGRAPRLRVAVGVAGVAAVLVAAWAVATSPRVPAAVTRAEILERNAAAWAETDRLAGSFVTGDGWYFEEWIRRQPEGLLYKRYSRPPETTVQRPQWNVSDGRTEWVVDADSRTVRAERPATEAMSPDAPPQERMQCAALALPPGLAEGPDPMPALLDGVPVYRLVGPMADGEVAVYWVDAGDSLVRRIDRLGGATVWMRQQLKLGGELAVDIFRPDALRNL